MLEKYFLKFHFLVKLLLFVVECTRQESRKTTGNYKILNTLHYVWLKKMHDGYNKIKEQDVVHQLTKGRDLFARFTDSN